MKAMFLKAVTAGAAVALWAGAASATTFDATTDGASTGNLAGVTFVAQDYDPTAGTGLIDPFLTIQNNPMERGYNSDIKTFEFDEKRGGQPGNPQGFTNSLLTSALTLVDGFYYMFIDFNEPQSGDGSKISILDFQIWTDTDGLNDSFGTGGFSATQLVWGLDSTSATTGVDQIDSRNFRGGSGQQDMYLKIDASLFVDPYEYLMVYAVMGWNCTGKGSNQVCEGTAFASDGGFEEISALTSAAVPVPAAGLMLLAGLGGLGALRRRRKIA